MKTFKLLAIAAMMVVSTTVQAKSKPGRGGAADGWRTLYVQWNPGSISPKKGDSQSFTGLSVGVSKAIRVSKSAPLYVEGGIALQYSFYSEEAEQLDEGISTEICDPENKFSMFSAKIPVNFVYNWKLPDSNVTLSPFAGLTLRFNFSGKITTEYNWDQDYIEEHRDERMGDEEFEALYGDKEVNLFDKEDMGSSDATWKRLQIGWQIGVNARFSKKYLVGISYGTDFSEICKKTKIHTTSVTLGYCF